MEPQLVNTSEAAKLLGLQPQTLRLWRNKGVGPRYVRLHGRRGRALYDIADVMVWLNQRKFKSTAEEAASVYE
jgi:DNA-binding transcriptional MerR regulator